MIIFLYGQDTYRSYRKMNEIIDHYKKVHKSGLNLKHFDFKKNHYEDFRNELKTVSIFSGRKLIVLKNSILNKDFQENLIGDIKKIADSKDIILLYENNDIPAKNKLLKSFKKYAKSQEYKLLKKTQLESWAKKEFEELGAIIDQKALEELISFVGNNLWQLSGEIKKIAAYKLKEKIELNDIELLVHSQIEVDIFKTIDAIAAKNKKTAFSLLHQHLKKGDSSLYLFSMINFQFRNLLMIKSFHHKPYYLPVLSKKIGMHPFVARKTIEQSRKFSLDELKRIYQKIFQFDSSIKTGKIEAKVALDLLVAEI